MNNTLQNGPKPPQKQSRGVPNTLFSLMTATVIPRHSCKISKEYFTFLKICNTG